MVLATAITRHGTHGMRRIITTRTMPGGHIEVITTTIMVTATAIMVTNATKAKAATKISAGEVTIVMQETVMTTMTELIAVVSMQMMSEVRLTVAAAQEIPLEAVRHLQSAMYLPHHPGFRVIEA